MLVLGLDPSLTNFGWALHDSLATGAGRCVSRGRFATKASMTFVDRYVFMRESLRQLLQDTKPDRVGIESPVFNDLFSEGMYGLFLYSNEALRIEQKDVVYFSPGQGKAHARETLGRPDKWKMLKADMVAAARHDTGGGTWNHNEADAYLIARLAARFWDFFEGNLDEAALTPVERKQFLLIHTFQRGKRAGHTVKKGLLYREEDRFFRWSQVSPDPDIPTKRP
jgi:hypothetical protein